jgi:hypothetical protein
MSTLAEVRTQWALVFAHADMQAITTRAHGWDLQAIADTAAFSEAHKALMMHNQQINFFQYQVSKSREKITSSDGVLYTYPVVVRYIREASLDIDGAAYAAVGDCFDTLFATVRSLIGRTWGSTVEFWQTQTDPPQIGLVTIDERICWQADYLFQGQKQATLS